MRKYELARALATMETVAELDGRLRLLGEAYAERRESSGRRSVEFESAFSQANAALQEEGISVTGATAPAAAQMSALVSLVDRAHRAYEDFSRTVQSGGVVQAGMGGGLAPLLIGAALLGVVWWLGKREPDFELPG